jgi:hypothetical protein
VKFGEIPSSRCLQTLGLRARLPRCHDRGHGQLFFSPGAVRYGKLRLRDKGLIAGRSCVDVTVFDAERVLDRATFAEPDQCRFGVAYVLVKGVVVIDHAEHTGDLPGMVLRKNPVAR